MKHTLLWDYTELADSYHKRPNYPAKIINEIIDHTDLKYGDSVCDMGAGTGNLSLLLAEIGLHVQALEPNLAMFERGVQSTRHKTAISWVNTTAEDSRLISSTYDMVSFGSSFNVVDRATALQESRRICKPGAWLMTIWNHRDLDDPLQRRIETCIKEKIQNYDYGLRRLDQRKYLLESGLFSQVDSFECAMPVKQAVDDVLVAWRSHATLKRQAGDGFNDIILEIATLLREHGSEDLEIPYASRAWVARFLDK
ncbi:MAG: methyltransferase domain-containing protein [Gammaproteobacteria bacterium]|nr:methyltransferase domain-containing protein [Gammaproteobacteria bacterium]